MQPQNLIMIVQLTLVAAAAAGVSALLWLNLRALRSAVSAMTQTLPNRALVEAMTSGQRELIAAIAAHQAAVDKLPAQMSAVVAAQVGAGLSGLVHEIEALHQGMLTETQRFVTGLAATTEALNKVLATLGDQGHLEDWVTALRESVAPFQQATASLNTQLSLTGEMLASLGQLAGQGANQEKKIGESFAQLTALLDRWSAAEMSHLRDIENRLLSRLEEVSATNNQVADALAVLKSASTRTLEAQQNLARSVQAMVGVARETLDLSRGVQTEHKGLLDAQRAAQDQIAQRQEGLDRHAQGFQLQMEALGQGVRTTLDGIVTTTARSVDVMRSELSTFHTSHQDALTQLDRRHAELRGAQGDLLSRMGTLVEQGARTLGSVPSRQNQTLLLAAMGVQVVLTGALIAAIVLT